MHCTNCGNQVDPQAVACMNCGASPKSQRNYCYNCGSSTNSMAVACTSCGVALGTYNPQTIVNGEQKEWLTTLLLCLFLGGFGVHRFYTGHTGIGLIQLFTLGGCGIWSLIDLIMIVTGSYRDANGSTLLKK